MKLPTLLSFIVLMCWIIINSYILNDQINDNKAMRSLLQDSIDSRYALFTKYKEKTDQLKRAVKMNNTLLPGWDADEPIFSKEVEVTVYTSRPEETDDSPYITASNQKVNPKTIALSRDLIGVVGKFGDEVIVDGYGSFIINDVMNKRYKNSVDIWMGDLVAAKKHGRRPSVTIYWQ